VTLGDAVLAALGAARRAGVDSNALWDAWKPAWRVAVIGAVSVGKTTLVNRLAGTSRPTGFGGVTREIAELALTGAILVDTPAIDGPCPWLAEVLEASDAVIWMIDPLRALGWSEREEVSTAWPEGLTLHCIVRRLRSDPAEEADVLERVRLLTAAWRPASISPCDLVRDPPPVATLVRAGAGPARRKALRAAVDGLQTALAPEDPAPWRAGWLAHVRAVERSAEALLLRSDAPDPELALLRAANGIELPQWPVPAVRHPSVRTSAGSGSANRRLLRAAAARWLAEGELSLLAWLGSRDRERAAARGALSDLATRLAQATGAEHSEGVR
jgi:hypothetical protein